MPTILAPHRDKTVPVEVTTAFSELISPATSKTLKPTPSESSLNPDL
jgi:hypothetical protein